MYTPQFSNRATVTVRRLAWALGVSIPKAVDKIVNELPLVFSPSVICPQCRDNTKCKFCGFYQQTVEVNTDAESAELSA
jgi:hypothetical protein